MEQENWTGPSQSIFMELVQFIRTQVRQEVLLESLRHADAQAKDGMASIVGSAAPGEQPRELTGLIEEAKTKIEKIRRYYFEKIESGQPQPRSEVQESWTLDDVVNRCEQLIDDYSVQRCRLQLAEAESQRLQDEVETIRQKVSDLMEAGSPGQSDQEIIESALLYVREHKEADSEFNARLQNDRLSFSEKVAQFCNTLDQIKRKVKSTAKPDEPLEDVVSRIVDDYDKVKEVKEDSLALARELSKYLNYSPIPDTELKQSLESIRGETQAQRLLRLGLSSTLIMLKDVLKGIYASNRTDVIEAINLDKLLNEGIYRKLLEESGNLRGNELWTDSLHRRFSAGELHELFRAELLIRSYFSGDDTFAALHDVLSQACVAIRGAMREMKIMPRAIALFCEPPDGATLHYDPDAKLRAVNEVNARVKQFIGRTDTTTSKELVVDVTYFGYKDANDRREAESPFHVLVLNPSRWRN